MRLKACLLQFQFLRFHHCRYHSSKFQSGEKMLEHINHVKSLHDKLREIGVNIDDRELAMTLLASLQDEFKPLITALDAVGEESV